MGTISIAAQPAPTGDLLTPYAPTTYEVLATTTYGNSPIVKAQVYINSAPYKSSYSQSHYKLVGSDYYFSFDISEILRSYLSNSDTLNLGGNTNVKPADDEANEGFAKKCYFKVVFELWEPSGANGIYEASGTDATSSSLYAINIAANQFLEESEIANYGAVLPMKFLTSAPRRQTTQVDGKAYLSFWDTGATRRGVRIRTYDNAGALQATAYIDIGQPLNSVYRVRRIAVGGYDISSVVSLTGIFSYDVAIVDDTTLLPPNEISEVVTYYLGAEGCNSVGYTLRFLNQFGADDAISFPKYVQSHVTQKQTYISNSSAYPTQEQRGATTLNSIGQQTITLVNESVPQRLMSWIYEARNTVLAFVQKRGSSQLLAVIVDEVREERSAGTDKQRRNVEISCTLSNQEYSHQN